MSEKKENSIDFFTLGLERGPEHPCPYIDGNVAQDRACIIHQLPNGIYRSLMDHGWRRSGKIIYRPDCIGCQQCQTIRVSSKEFSPNKTQRKIFNRNQDLESKVSRAQPTEEKYNLFVQYQKSRHDGTMCTKKQEFVDFLYVSPVKTWDVCLRLNGELVGVCVFDLDGQSISALYSYYDSSLQKRSLGTYLVLWLLNFARKVSHDHVYLGYFIQDSPKMNYKSRFKPYELLQKDGSWKQYG